MKTSGSSIHDVPRIELVLAHAEGEIGKVAVSGLDDIPGNSIREKLNHINRDDDSLRRFLVDEPRGKSAQSVNLMLPAQNPEADFAHIVLQQDAAHATSGSNSMCMVTVAIETGLVAPKPEVVIETAAGLVRCRPTMQQGRCRAVAVTFPPCFFVESDTIKDPTFGSINVEIAFGGVFYLLVDIRQIALAIHPDNAKKIVAAGMRLFNSVRASKKPRHPETDALNYFSYLMFYEPVETQPFTYRHCTVLPPGRVDRSPCGTGSSARAAGLFAAGNITAGDTLTAKSILDTEFRVRIREAVDYFGFRAILPEVTGRAWVYGYETLLRFPEDPFPLGFSLAGA